MTVNVIMDFTILNTLQVLLASRLKLHCEKLVVNNLRDRSLSVALKKS